MRNMADNTPISICIITKNECDTLKECLKHLKPYADAGNHEIVIVDTGSTDNTVEMCKEFTDKIFFFEWINDFSAARNYAAEKASNDWILCIDSDEYVTEWDEKSIQSSIECGINSICTIDMINTGGFGENSYQEKSSLLRFYNRKMYLFTNAIHEQITPIKDTTLTKYNQLKILLLHNSYSGTKEKLLPKAKRNISMLKKQLSNNPNDAYTLYQLGQSNYMIEEFEEALKYYSQGLEQDVDPTLYWVKNMVVSYGYCLLNLNQCEKVLELEGIYDTFCEYADYVFLIGYIYMKNGYFNDAIKQFELATTNHDYSVLGSNSFRAWYNIGVIYECAGMIDLAKEYYKKCGNYQLARNRLLQL